jgi:tetratricopeptide (TPR) repeat protein
MALAYCNRGLAKYDRGRFDEALAEYDEAIRIDASITLALTNRGVVKHALGRYDDAIADFDAALRLDPAYAPAYGNRGNTKHAKGLNAEAIADYDRMILLQPKDALAHMNRGDAHRELDQFDEAISDYERAFVLAPSSWSHASEVRDGIALAKAGRLFASAMALHKSNQHREALEELTSVVASSPKSRYGIAAAYNAACCHARLGEKSEALDWLEKAVEMGWKDLAHLQKDDDVASLRGGDRYKKLVAKLKGER